MRYIIGIDLGTTNSSVAFIDTQNTKLAVQGFKIPQLISEGQLAQLPVLPSFCYLASPHEWLQGTIDLPWLADSDFFVGSFALAHGGKVPTRLVQSAKSWLCHSAANRQDKILPVEADERSRISPVEATRRYLGHLKAAWNEVMAKGNIDAEFDEQEIIVTVPASFDEVARTLTVEAAKLAGFAKMTLLEEPQAAFYSWIAQHEDRWSSLIPIGATILVCDVGGGTTDFSLIEVVEKNGKPAFQRMAVGNHLLLGGDNMDAAIAYFIESKLGIGLVGEQLLQLRHQARKAKERLLHSEKQVKGEESYHVILQGMGSNVIQGSLSVTITRQEIEHLLLEGFFGYYPWEDALKLRKATGIRSMGLPYEEEPSITKHLAHFLAQKSGSAEFKQPDFVLFNGGTMKPMSFQKAIIDSLQQWFPQKKISVLPTFSLDHAVARGAAYYGKARRGMGAKIGGGTARGYYLVLDTKNGSEAISKKALSLVPRGSEEGYVYEPQTNFQLSPNVPVSFQLCSSHVRLQDQPGALVEINHEEMQLLPSIQTVLRFGKQQLKDTNQEKIPVNLQIALTPIGTLEIELKSLKTSHQWKLEFQLRSAVGAEDSMATLMKRESDQTFHQGFLEEAKKIILQTFGSDRENSGVERLVEKLEQVLGLGRGDWPPSMMRGLADIILSMAPFRKASTSLAERWWNLMGFLLRPGFGYALDDFRLKELWKIILSDYKGPHPLELQLQMWICYRRIAGGLNKGQQTQLVNELMNGLIKKNDKIEIKGKSETYAYSEKIRAIGAMELIDASIKIRLGNALVNRICSGVSIPADYWALGRIGARLLLYGSLANVCPREWVEKWIKLLLTHREVNNELTFVFSQLARKTAHRELNLSEDSIQQILNKWMGTSYQNTMEELLLKENRLSQSEQEKAFGDHLPSGLSLIHEP